MASESDAAAGEPQMLHPVIRSIPEPRARKPHGPQLWAVVLTVGCLYYVWTKVLGKSFPTFGGRQGQRIGVGDGVKKPARDHQAERLAAIERRQQQQRLGNAQKRPNSNASTSSKLTVLQQQQRMKQNREDEERRRQAEEKKRKQRQLYLRRKKEADAEEDRRRKGSYVRTKAVSCGSKIAQSYFVNRRRTGSWVGIQRKSLRRFRLFECDGPPGRQRWELQADEVQTIPRRMRQVTSSFWGPLVITFLR